MFLDRLQAVKQAAARPGFAPRVRSVSDLLTVPLHAATTYSLPPKSAPILKPPAHCARTDCARFFNMPPKWPDASFRIATPLALLLFIPRHGTGQTDGQGVDGRLDLCFVARAQKGTWKTWGTDVCCVSFFEFQLFYRRWSGNHTSHLPSPCRQPGVL